ncbi:serine protease inhibitor [Caldicoprobacter guelmensis]|uniref:serpin family protein n=1 Tax=Caldicoprobacter guelmensis TaxID=1170224 RepID=UPI00195E411C|nr:serpin family protein [Caldicoprobacter guelmensis]MBM7581527.1 serine protease inhibitor [Caldicoprobacter guelmensis]
MRIKHVACMYIVVFVTAVILTSCSMINWASIAGSKLPPPAEKVDERLVDANIEFSFKLFNQLIGDQVKDNVFICPASVSLALSMTYNGADGETKEAMAQALQLQNMSIEDVNKANADLLTILQNPDPDIKVSIANSIWIREGVSFYKEFLDVNKRFYNAYIEHLNFSSPQAPNIINNWIKECTNGRIDKVIEDPLTKRFSKG